MVRDLYETIRFDKKYWLHFLLICQILIFIAYQTFLVFKAYEAKVSSLEKENSESEDRINALEDRIYYLNSNYNRLEEEYNELEEKYLDLKNQFYYYE